MMNSLASYPAIIVILLYTHSPVWLWNVFAYKFTSHTRPEKKKYRIFKPVCQTSTELFSFFFFFFPQSDLQMLQKTHAWLVSSSGRGEEV